MARGYVVGLAVGFKRSRGGASILKATRDDGAPTLLMRPRAPLFKEPVELHISASAKLGLAVTLESPETTSDEFIADVLYEAYENVDLAREKKWDWWRGVLQALRSRPAVPSKGIAPQAVAEVPRPAASPSGGKVAGNAAPKEPQPLDETRVAAAVERRLVPWLMGIAALVAFVGFALYRQRSVDRPPPEVQALAGDSSWETRGPLTLGERRLPLWDWQDRPPCEGVAEEVDSGCWIPTLHKPPCPKQSWEKNGKCWVPAASHNPKREPRAGEDPKSPTPAETPR